MFALKMRAQELGVAFVNAWGSVMYAGQLYNAAFQEKLLSKTCLDMDLVISLQGQDKFFVGDAPKGLEEYWKRFMLSIGYSATVFANNRRPNANVVSSKGPRCLAVLCAVGKLFPGRYCNNGATTRWTSEEMKQVIESKFDDESEGEDDHDQSSATNQSERREARVTKTSSSGALIEKPRRDVSSIKTTDFLFDIANALHAETLEMSLDYLRVHRVCWRLLRSVNDVCKPRLLQTYGAGYLEREDQLPFVVGYILMAATATSQLAGVLIPRRSEIEVSSRLLMSAAEAVDGMLQSGIGALEIKVLKQFLNVELEFEDA